MTDSRDQFASSTEERAREMREKTVTQNREDFMKRWFAIAISVGFATALSNMPWLKERRIFDWRLPVDWDQVQQIFRLTVAASATIFSWEGYLLSISAKPLKDQARFYIDVFLVFIYLLLLLTSKFSYFWLWIHAGTFILYILWDYLSIKQYPSQYAVYPPASEEYVPKISDVYRGSLGDDPRIYRGPAITLMWPIYFFVLPISYQFVLSAQDREKPLTTFFYMLFVFYGLHEYRRDKRVRLAFWDRWTLILGAVLAVLLLDIVLHRR